MPQTPPNPTHTAQRVSAPTEKFIAPSLLTQETAKQSTWIPQTQEKQQIQNLIEISVYD